MTKTIERTSNNVIYVKFDDVKSGWEQWLLLTSDRHYDSAHTDRQLQKLHLEQASARDALVIDNGDIFDAMQGRNDPRASYAELRPEYVGRPDYFNAIVGDTADFLRPYKKNILMLGRGNHETSVEKKNQIDLISMLIAKIGESEIMAGGYGGYVKFGFRRGTWQKSVNLKYMHGWGGGGPVTRGVIDTNRQAVYLPDANIVVNGHTHDSWYMPIARERIDQNGKLSQDICHFIRTPTYKNDYGDGSGGWHVETGKPPKPRGCVWLRFYYYSEDVHIQVIPDITV